MSLRIVSSSEVSTGTPGRGKPVLISTNPPGLADSGEGIKDVGGRSELDDEVPLIVGFDVGESRSEVGRGRVDACGMYMLAGSTSSKVEGWTCDREGLQGK
jgi:hypothetical protein